MTAKPDKVAGDFLRHHNRYQAFPPRLFLNKKVETLRGTTGFSFAMV
jgi:hypothetical protein